MQPIISLEIKGTSGRGVRGAGRGYMDTVFSSTPFLKQYQDLCFSKNNLARIKDGGYAINLDDKKSKGTPQVSLYIDRNTALYFDSLELNITTNIVRFEFKLKKLDEIRNYLWEKIKHNDFMSEKYKKTSI